MEITTILKGYYGNMENFGNFITNTLPILVFVFAFLDIILLIIEGSLKKRNDDAAKEIHIDAMEPAQIAAAVSAMGYPKNKNSGINAEGKAFIKGKYGVYTFGSDENGVSIEYDDSKKISRLGEYLGKHKRYRRSCEALVIMQWLKKHLDPTSPADCRRNYKKLKSKGLIDRLPFTLSVLSLLGVIGGYYIFMSLNETVNTVRFGKSEAYDISYIYALEGYLDDVKWDTYYSDKGKRAINAKGKAKYAFDGEDVLVQFLLDDNGSDFEVYAIEIGGTPITDDAILCLLYEMFENYKNKEETSAFDSVDTLEEIASELSYSDDDEDEYDEDIDEEEYDEDIDEEEKDEPVTTTTKRKTTTTTTTAAEPEPEVYDGPLTIDSYPDAIIGYWEDPEFDHVYCFNDDGSVDHYIETYRGSDEYEYMESYNYWVSDGILYMEQYVGTTTCYKITFDGADRICAEEFDQGMLGYGHKWVRRTDFE